MRYHPRSLAQMPGALERFRAEVRNARQIAHPNVCRVYDIGEAEGHHFLTMEFVDGEDLATLLRRIGSLPTAKANEVASQLCAGLAAAHDRGVLHRDLKPSNVMIDGHGRVRITDFGLAVRMEQAATDFAGTPAYMAPEQFEGGVVTVRTDLYSLGLILYEVYTGRRPFDATSVAEWKSRHTQSTPSLHTSRDLVLDDSVERAILRCLEKDPALRPASARQLAAALPGGDPLAATMAAGETPSPEMVAAAGGEGALAPRTAWGLILAVVVTMAGIVAIGPFSGDLGLAPMTMGPEVLRDRAIRLLEGFGYRDALDRESWLTRVYAPMLHVSKHSLSTRWRSEWRRVGAPILLVLRQSPRWMATSDLSGRITEEDPPFDVSEMAAIAVDARGQLRVLRVVPPQLDSLRREAPFDWGVLFKAAGFDSTLFHRVPPVWVPPDASDAHAEWVGTVPELPGVPLRVAAAAYGGRPVYFRVFGPWSLAERMERPKTTLTTRIAGYTIATLTIISVVAALFLVRRNQRLGRGDSAGARKLAGALIVLTILGWLMSAHHVADVALEGIMFLSTAGDAVLFGALMAFMYLAAEPFVRRRMPELMIGWARVLEGRFNDPRVGRDLLVGALAGSSFALFFHASNALPTWIPILGQTPVPPDARILQGGPVVVSALIGYLFIALVRGLSLFFMLFLVRLIVKREQVAMIAMMLLMSLSNLGGENYYLETPFAVMQGVVMGWVVARVGLLAAVSMWFFRTALAAVPLPITASAPYALSSALVLILLIAVAAYATRISVGTRPLFSAAALDDA